MHGHTSEQIAEVERLSQVLLADLGGLKAAEEAYEAEDALFDDWIDDQHGKWWRVKEGIETAYPRWKAWHSLDIASKRAKAKAAKTFNELGRAVDPDEFTGELIEEWEFDDELREADAEAESEAQANAE